MISDELHDRLKHGDKDAYDELVQLAVQEALRILPIVNENIIKQSAVLHDKSKQFYVDNPELTQNKKLVAGVIERIEGENPGLAFEDILKKAAPEAKSAMASMSQVDPKKRRIAELDDVVGSL